MKVEYITGPDVFSQDDSAIMLFQEAYPASLGITGCAFAVGDDALEEVDAISLVVLRVFIENSRRLREGTQKYVVGIRFSNFGDMATIDVISLDKPNHRDIALEHCRRMGYHVHEGKLGAFEQTYQLPFLFVGGFLNLTEDGDVVFHGASQDYGSDVILGNANEIATSVASLCEIQVGKADTTVGQTFLERVLELMKEYKMSPMFYEALVDHVFRGNTARDYQKAFIGQHLGALMTMKAIDRVLAEGGDFLQKMVEEVAGGGLSRHVLLSSVMAQQKPKPE